MKLSKPLGKDKPKTTTAAQSPNTLIFEKGLTEGQTTLERGMLSPSLNGALTVKAYSKKYGDIDLTGLANALSEQSKAVNKGDLKRAEAMLMVQAHTLDAIFNNLAQRSIKAEYMSSLDQYLRLALKAQSQCRATLETLATIKNPSPVAFVRQANITSGPQQVNNGVAMESPRAGISENQPNKILEHQHGERLDFGAAGAASGVDSTLETVGTGHRPQDKSG